MKPPLLLLLLLFTSTSISSSISVHLDLSQCFSDAVLNSNTNASRILHVPNTPSYTSILRKSVQNLRFSSPSTPKPTVIFVPSHESHVQAAVECCRSHGVAVRVRSGGHDYEGLSYRSNGKNGRFAMIDLGKLREIRIDAAGRTAWAEAGATLGDLYYVIAKSSKGLAFPGGTCASVGLGGQLGGGGLGTLLRKHGLAADNILDARIIDARGRVLDRTSMGEDLFWAIRGGGGSFGVVLSWKLKLVPVPSTITAFTIARTEEQGAISLLHKWQTTAPDLPEDLFIRVIVHQSKLAGGKVAAVFNSLHLGSCRDLLLLVERRLPELGLEAKDCMEMSWTQSTLYFAGYRSQDPPEVLLDRGSETKSYFKGKSDFVEEPILEEGLRELWSCFLEEGAGMVIMEPFGGKMSTVAEEELPFPHRKGNLYSIQYFVHWEGEWGEERALRWVEKVYGLMTPWVSSDPRRAYLNYRDLGLGGGRYWGKGGWGRSYFMGNTVRLAKVKGRIDPEDVFRSEQSVPLGTAFCATPPCIKNA